MNKAWLVCLLFLSACAVFQPEERYWLKGSGLVIDDGTSLLHYSNYVRELSHAERDKEIEKQRLAYVRDKSDFRRVQYALALMSPYAGYNERRLAGQLIEPVLDGQGHAPGVVAVAGLLDSYLQNLRKADDSERKLDALKDIERSLLQRESYRQPAKPETPAKRVKP